MIHARNFAAPYMYPSEYYRFLKNKEFKSPTVQSKQNWKWAKFYFLNLKFPMVVPIFLAKL